MNIFQIVAIGMIAWCMASVILAFSIHALKVAYRRTTKGDRR